MPLTLIFHYFADMLLSMLSMPRRRRRRHYCLPHYDADITCVVTIHARYAMMRARMLSAAALCARRARYAII